MMGMDQFDSVKLFYEYVKYFCLKITWNFYKESLCGN